MKPSDDTENYEPTDDHWVCDFCNGLVPDADRGVVLDEKHQFCSDECLAKYQAQF